MITCELSGHELLRKMPTAQRPSQALLPAGATLGESPGGQGAATGLGSWNSQEDGLRRIRKPQQPWRGLTWSSAQDAPGKVSRRPCGADSLSEQGFSLRSPKTGREAAP